MNKRDLIDQIMQANPGAKPDFLAEFDQVDLLHYLSKLRLLSFPALPVKTFRTAVVCPKVQVDSPPAPAKRTIEVPAPCPASKTPHPVAARVGLFRPADTQETPAPMIDLAPPTPRLLPPPTAVPVAVAVGDDRTDDSAQTLADENWLF